MISDMMTADMKNDYTETLLNMILDEIDDIILIHDSEHTIVWMNMAGLKKFNVKLDDVIGKRCYTLFKRNTSCEDCNVSSMHGSGSEGQRLKTIPYTHEDYLCTSMPLYQDGEIKLVVQHLTKCKKTDRSPIKIGNQ